MKNVILTAVMLLFGIAESAAQSSASLPLTVASYNIRNANNGDRDQGNGWEKRCPVMCNLIKFNDFDIFGTQEVLHQQLTDMLATLTDYGYVGVGRDDGKGKGEYSPILYKRSRLKLLDSGTFWMAPDTSRPNVGWDAALPRICSWGKFSDLTTGKKLWFFNLHMDHIGVLARAESAKLVLSKIQEMCSDDAVILTGDFNFDQRDSCFPILADSKILRDSYSIANVCYAPNGTFNAYDINRATDQRIDHIFVSQSIDVDRYGILTDTYRSQEKNGKTTSRIASDHYPVVVKLQLK